jgi:hypothetical protein
MVHVHHAEIPVPHEGIHVGLEIDGDAVGETAAAGHGYAQLLTHGTVHAVGRDEVIGDDHLLRPADVGTDHRDNVAVAGLEGHQVGAEQMLRTEVAGALAEDRLKPDLGDEQPVGRAQAFHPVVVRPVEVRQFLPAQALHGDDGAALPEFPGRGLFHLPLQPNGTEDLHCPLVERGGAGMDRGARVALNDKMRHPIAGQQNGRGQADEAAAHHEDLSVTFRHPGSFPAPPRRASRRQTELPHICPQSGHMSV